MTKKILALALAGTTAFSVFASAMSVNAATVSPGDYDGAYEAYTVTVLAVAGNGSTNPYNFSTANIGNQFNFDGADQSLLDDRESGTIYLYDYAVRSAATDEQKSDLKKKAEATGTSGIDLWNAFNAVYETTGGVPQIETITEYGRVSKARADAFYNLGKIYRDNIQKYTAADSDGGTEITIDELTDVYDENDVIGYNLLELFKDIKLFATLDPAVDQSTENDIAGNPLGAAYSQGIPTSKAIHLVQSYNRIMTDYGVNGADTTTIMDKYDELYTKLSERVSDDYTSANWRNFQRLLEDAAELAAEADTVAKWNKAYAKLQDAEKVECEAGKYTDLQNALLALFIDIKTSNIPAVYSGIDSSYPNYSKAVYPKSDYMETNIRGQRDASAAYYTAFIDQTINGTLYKSAYTKAYDIWKEARKYGAKVAQSDIDNALADLEAAIEALDPSSSAPNYQLVLLETAVETVSSYQESDYNTASKKYKDFAAALQKAEEVLAKTSPAASEVTSAFDRLATTASDLASVTKKPSAALTRSLKNALNEANISLKEMSSKQGAQYIALQEAIAVAGDILNNNWDGDNIKTTKNYVFKEQSTISDYETAIANLETAINGFFQTQSWYQEAGAWKYGVDNGVLNNGWNKLGNFWFYFGEDGVAKQNDWMTEGGKWYYFGNSCVAYTGWGKVDGSWYYFGKDCAMATGWIRPSHSYYYMDPSSGKMITGWAQISGKWYYFSTESHNLGAMLTSTTTPDGYQVGADGAMI